MLKVTLTIQVVIVIMRFLQRHCVIVFVLTSAHVLLGAFPLLPQLCSPWLSACSCLVRGRLLGHQM